MLDTLHGYTNTKNINYNTSEKSSKPLGILKKKKEPEGMKKFTKED